MLVTTLASRRNLGLAAALAASFVVSLPSLAADAVSASVSGGAESAVSTAKRERFRASLQASHTSDLGDGYAHAEATLSIPAGKKLIVDRVTVSSTVTSKSSRVLVEVVPDAGRSGAPPSSFPVTKQESFSPGANLWTGSHPVSVTASSELTVRIAGSRGRGLETNLYASVSGYLVPDAE